MKRIIRTIIFTLFASSSLLVVPVMAVHAVDVIAPICDGTNGINDSQVCKDDLTNSDSNPIFGPKGILTIAISIISAVAAIVAVIIIIIAGIRFMTSQGNAQTVSTARNQIIYALIALAVAALAQGIVAFVLKRLK